MLLADYLAAIGYQGVARPADENLVYPLIDVEVELKNTGDTLTLTGPATTSPAGNGPGLWVNDPNLKTFMPDTGRFFLISDRFQFRISPRTVDPVQLGGIAKLVGSLKWVHAPKVGNKQYVYPALPGAVIDPTITAVSLVDPAGAQAAAGVQFDKPGFRDYGFALAIDFANDKLTIEYDAVPAAPATVKARLQWFGFAKSYDGEEAFFRAVRSSDPRGLLAAKAARRSRLP